MEKSEKKKKKKIFFKRTFSLAVFLFPMIKSGKKYVVLFFSVRGEGKCEIDNKKRKFFFSFRELFNSFWWLVCRKR